MQTFKNEPIDAPRTKLNAAKSDSENGGGTAGECEPVRAEES